MRLKRWQAVLFATSILWGLVGTAILITTLPEETSNLQTTIIKSQSTSPRITGQIFDAKFDSALRTRLQEGVGENDVLNVIILLDPQNPQSDAVRAAIQSVGGEVEYEYHLFPGILAAIPATALVSLAGFPAIARICDDRIETIPQDMSPATALVDTSNWWRSAVRADDVSETGMGVKVAILDTGLGYLSTSGVNGYHMDLPYSRIAAYRNFAMEDDVVVANKIYDGNGHGTHTAGIAVGNGDASSGAKYQGIAPDADLLVCKVLNSSGAGEFSDILKGIEWAVDNGAQVISMSLGGGFPEVFTEENVWIQNATEHGALVVASAGNSGPDYFSGGVPGSSLYTISVAASDRNNDLADFSSVGPTWSMQSFPSITAPGVDIIAPLGAQSAIEKEETYFENVITGTSGSDYVPLSGTSMSAPIVAGAAALLLEHYDANPLTLRIAMMESAVDLNVATVRQGSGLLDVSAAWDYLAFLDSKPDINNVTKVYPKQLPFEPYDLLQFPGDAQTMNLTVISGMARSITVQLPSIPGIQLTTSQPTLNFANAGVKLWNLTVSVDWNASTGVKSGVIKFNDTTTGEILDQVSLNLTITLPKRRVYFDSFHGLNDYFDYTHGVSAIIEAPIYNNPQYELYNLAKTFTAKNYSVDLKMEVWTPGYVPDRDGRLLTYDLLQNYDVVVLQTPTLPYTPTEVQALVDFRARNGSILVIGDRHQSLAVDSVNNLLSRLGTGISFLTENLESTQFYGLYGIANTLLISPTSPKDPMLTGVQSLLFQWGALLQISGTSRSVLNATGLLSTYHLAAKSTGTGTAGNVVVLSGPSLLKNYYMTYPDYGGNHTQFASNLIDYLLPAQSFNIARRVSPERSSSGVIDTYLYISNGSTGQPITGLISGTDLNLTSSNPAVPGVVNFISVTMEVAGIYRNASYTLNTASPSSYFLNASATVNAVHRNVTGAAICIAINPPQFTSTSQTRDVIDRSAGGSGAVDINLSGININYVDLYVGSTPYSIFNTKVQSSFNKSDSVAPYKFPISDLDSTSGYYSYFFEASNGAGYNNSNSIRWTFAVFNYAPIISESNSYFDQSSFSSMKSDESYYIQDAKQLETYSFEVSASDDEDPENQLTGVVVFVPAYLLDSTIGFMLGSGDLPVEGLSYTSLAGLLTGSIQIPSTVTMPKGDGTDLLKSTASGGDYLAVFEVAVMDTEGASADYIVILDVAPSLNILLLVLIIVAIAAAVGVLVFVLVRRHRANVLGYGKRPRYSYKSAYETPASSGYGTTSEAYITPTPLAGNLRKFCPYCGQPIPMEANQCPNCGANIPSPGSY